MMPMTTYMNRKNLLVLLGLVAIASLVALLPQQHAGAAEAVATEGANLGEWTMDFDAAKELAKKEDLPMLINFTGSDWCGWCKLMDKEVFAKDEWKAYAKENLVLVTIDFPQDDTIVPAKYKARNDQLSAQYGIEGFPTYMLLSGDDQTIIGRLGASQDATPAGFIKDVKALVRRNTAKGIADYTSNLTQEQADAYRKANKQLSETNEALQAWMATQPEPNEANMQKFQQFSQQVSTLEKELRDIEIAHLAKTLEPEQAKELNTTYKSLSEVTAELQRWFMTQPENTAENREKLKDFQTKIQQLEEQLARYE